MAIIQGQHVNESMINMQPLPLQTSGVIEDQ